jgi:citrate lyase subunit beta/citryl-CoA lyase
MRRVRRACLIVPGNSDRMLEKAASLGPDEVVIDLEDAVPPAEKNAATRARVADALSSGEWRARTLAVRVNAPDSEWFADDVAALVGDAGERVDSFVIPKVESAETVAEIDRLLAELEAQAGIAAIELELQIESALALTRVDEIAAAADRNAALVFGPGDFAASLGVPQASIGVIDPAYPGDQWHYARSRIAVAAHAFGLDPVDGPFAAYRDADGLVESARRARLVGFVGKWVIHPDQIEPCTRAFSPSEDEVAAARRVVDALDGAAREGRGAATLDGAMIDEASRKLAEAVLARAPE